MPVKVVLRTSKSHSPFRDILNRLITCPIGESLILCSGYIWEPDADSSTYKILDDGLLETIKKGCASGVTVTVAGKFSEEVWKEHYRNFVFRLRDAGVRVQAFVAPKKNWHAKIAIRLKGKVPIAALVGSSNLTGPAYRLNSCHWNFESDVLIWPNNPELNTYFRSSLSNQNRVGNLDLILDPEVQQLSEQEQLDNLLSDIESGNLTQLDSE